MLLRINNRLINGALAGIIHLFVFLYFRFTCRICNVAHDEAFTDGALFALHRCRA